MKKKVIIFIFIVFLFLSNCLVAYATEIIPKYNIITGVESEIKIQNAQVYYVVKVYEPSKDALDSVRIEATLKKSGAGNDIAVYNEELKQSGRMFYFSENKRLTSKGAYYLEYTVICYKNGKVVDRVSTKSKTAIY